MAADAPTASCAPDATGPAVDASWWRLMMQASPTLCLCVDGAGRISEASAALLRLLQRDPALLRGQALDAVLSPECAADLRRFVSPDGRPSGLRDHPCELADADGDRWPMRLHIALRRDRHGRPIGALYTFIDTTERERLVAQLERAARSDSLTGCWNRPWLLEQLRLAINRARHAQDPLCLMVLQLEHFRELNDQCGYAFGDTALCSMVASVRRLLREDDAIGRLGGACFAVVLPGVSLVQADALVQRIRAAIADLSIAQAGVQRRLEARVHLAEVDPGIDAETAIAKAERAISGGRRRVVPTGYRL